ncbi:hypothetical protein [Cupriavidus metallidurans]|uniref:hypothetical protein n=1 Tax=Cupriavidus metallidurans TaxID=119219 RepID=UPI000CE047F1|nr:hypothetical protein [Cupriavidus metallidurans]AVA33344.1 hypothetical protein C3Z06_06700 [Cupriavidus metallidurans]
MDELKLFGGVIQAPAFLPAEVIDACKTYREAVRLSWMHRRIKGMTQRTLAELTECYASHVSDYLASDDKPSRRSLPAEKLNAWAAVTGNWGVQQWLMHQSKLTVMEEVIAHRSAA